MRRSCIKALITEEPDERIVHVRVCGGTGWVTGWFYPEANGYRRR